MELNPQLEGTETKPQMLQIVAPGEAVVAIGFEVKIGENSGILNLCLPSVMLKMLKMKRAVFDQQWKHGHPEMGGCEAEKTSSILRSARVNLSSEIRDNTIVVEDLLRMSAGDIIQLNHAVGDPVRLNVGGVPKFYGRIVARRGKRALEISHKYVY
jgi:flagellar motor switch protein FliM